MTHTAICCHPSSATAGLVLATTLRRMGEAVDLLYAGKLDRQFNRAKKAGAAVILTVEAGEQCRLWRRWTGSVGMPLRDAEHYLTWLAQDETQVLPEDVIPDPPAYFWNGEMVR